MTARMLGRRPAFRLLALGVVFAAFLVPAQARADVFCDYVDAGEPGVADNLLAVTALGSGDDFFEGEEEEGFAAISIHVAKADGRIKVRAPDGPVSCEGAQPTATNIDSVRILASINQSVVLDLGGGPFAPGATDEGDESSEIEISFVGEYGHLFVRGGPGPNRMVIEPTPDDDGMGLNLNPRLDRDRDDLDVTAAEQSGIILLGGRGGDSLIARGTEDAEDRPLDFVYMVGGPGNDSLLSSADGYLIGGEGDDLLRGGPSFSALVGRGGNDTLLGGADRDYLVGGNGSDELRGGRDRDVLFARDGRAERVDCGPGEDRLRSSDRGDGHHSCEKRHRGERGDPFGPVRISTRSEPSAKALLSGARALSR